MVSVVVVVTSSGCVGCLCGGGGIYTVSGCGSSNIM